MVIFRLEFEKTIVMLKFSTFNLSKCNISFKKKIFFKCWTKVVLFGYFWAGTRKSYFFYISTLKFFQTKFCPKIKIFKFGTKIVLIGYFGLEFQKTNVEFQISILEFVKMQSFIQKQESFKLGTRNTLLRYFWAAI